MTFRKPTLHVTILTLFLSFLFVTAGSLTYYNYRENSKAATEIAQELLLEVSEKTSNRVETLFESTIMLTNEVAELSNLGAKPDFMTHPSKWFLAETLLARPNIYSVYIGYADGEFFQIIALPEDEKKLAQSFGAPLKARMAVRHIFKRPLDGRRVELWQFYDEERHIIGSRSVRVSAYDPRERPWYHKASVSEGVISTDFYIFESTASMGITFARRFDGAVPGVFGVDITLDGMSEFFSEQDVGESGYVFMFDERLLITAHPDPSQVLVMTETPKGKRKVHLSLKDLHDPLMPVLVNTLKEGGGTNRSLCLEAEGVEYLVRLDSLEENLSDTQYLAVVAPLSDFTGNMDRTRERSLIFAAVIILLAIPIAIFNSRMMSRPLHLLAVAADKIRHFNLDSPITVRSHIEEIDDLSKAVKAMQTSLSSFGRYVPKTLVKRMLLEGTDPKLGGARREATMLFTDIADFTTISEGMEGEELMLAVSDYLQEISWVILEYGGTIDKYIGDAVMAFWNAPVRQENHAELACDAALHARDVSEALNAKWREVGRPVMFTRFGLHTGEPIIGNVGSDDRMNYTAMGAPVNIASRLEGLNKYYGTQILASETVVAAVGDKFTFRSVGKVLPKGVTSPVKVFELVGRAEDFVCTLDSDMESCSVELWETAYASYEAHHFEDAAIIFEKFLKANPKDHLAATMLERAKELAENPPGDDWDMTDVFKSK